jgi:hypothetical protein
VYADGKYKDRLFDGRKNIGLPWPQRLNHLNHLKLL